MSIGIRSGTSSACPRDRGTASSRTCGGRVCGGDVACQAAAKDLAVASGQGVRDSPELPGGLGSGWIKRARECAV